MKKKNMICTNCFRLTMEREANERKHNTGKCNHCGGELKPHKHPKERDDLIAAHRSKTKPGKTVGGTK